MSTEQFSRATGAPQVTATALKAQIEMLHAEIVKLEALMAACQRDFQAADNRDRAAHVMSELLRMTADLMSAQEATTRLEGELTALRVFRSSRPWWLRTLAG